MFPKTRRITMAKYDAHRAFLERILETMNKNAEELQARLDDLEDQTRYIEDAISALNVYEHIPSDGVNNG